MHPDHIAAVLETTGPLIDAANAAHYAGDHKSEAHYLAEIEHTLDRLDEARQRGSQRGSEAARG